jgi:hypothetical protein
VNWQSIPEVELWYGDKTGVEGELTPEELGPNSPDFNPIERIYLIVKAEYFANIR